MFLPNISYPILDGVTAKYQCFVRVPAVACTA